MADKINDVDPRIAAWAEEWMRNRAMVEGERIVKSAAICERYLPREPGLTPTQHKNIVKRTPFFPGAARAHEGLLGLIFRKKGAIEAPANVESILETITADYLTVEDLAEEVAGEFITTNFVGLLVDLPSTGGKVMSQAEAEASGNRPFIAVYPAESILGVEPGKVNGMVQPVRVRLQEDALTILELRFDAGVYTVTKWTRENEQSSDWLMLETVTPLRGGKSLPGIPFTLVTSNRRMIPAKAKISDVASINAQHYIASANLAVADFFASHPTPYLFGPKVTELSLAPGSFISAEGKGGDIKIGMLEYSGETMAELGARITTLSSDMAKVGSRILADEKAAVEAAETVEVKMAAENAALASTARLISRKINDALKWVAFWLGLPEGSITYTANTDYGRSKLGKDDVVAFAGLWTQGVYSKDALLDILIDGEVLPEGFDKEADKEKLAQEAADRPPVTIPAFNPKDLAQADPSTPAV